MTSRKTDLELLKEFHSGDESAYVELMEKYTEKVFNLAYRITRNHQDSEEVIQDVFVTVYLKSKSFEGKSAFSSWLYRITANACFMKLRKRNQTPTVSIDDVGAQAHEGSLMKYDSATCDTNFMTTRHELREMLEKAIMRLPDDYRLIFILRDIDGLASEEVSQIVGLSVAAVKSRLHRSRLMLRKKLQSYYDDYINEDEIFLSPKAATIQTCAAVH